MQKYSLTYVGVFTMIAAPFLVQQVGFSEACSGEILEKTTPYVSMIPGAFMALLGRFRLGGVTKFGVKK